MRPLPWPRARVAANQRRATMPPGGIVAGVHMVGLRTPPEPLLLETPWQSKTPSNTHEFRSQLKLVRDSFTRLPVTAQTGFSQLVKGAELMLH
jgi:hypothetical protein